MPRFKVLLEYEGTRYSGWQVQREARTIQGEFFTACKEVFGTETFEFYGAGRTDGGVHASGQIAHLDVATKLAPDKMRIKLNDLLPYDINILRIDVAHPRFHARHDAVARSYVYIISKRRTAFGKNYVWWVKDRLDIVKMREIAKLYVGFKDFASFSDKSPEEKSTMVEVQYVNISEKDDLIFIHIIGSHFLWKMVRRLVGVMVEAGRGKTTTNEVNSYFTTKSPRPAQLTAPPSGLYLERVYYPGDKISKDFYVFPTIK